MLQEAYCGRQYVTHTTIGDGIAAAGTCLRRGEQKRRSQTEIDRRARRARDTACGAVLDRDRFRTPRCEKPPAWKRGITMTSAALPSLSRHHNFWDRATDISAATSKQRLLQACRLTASQLTTGVASWTQRQQMRGAGKVGFAEPGLWDRVRGPVLACHRRPPSRELVWSRVRTNRRRLCRYRPRLVSRWKW